MDYFNFKYTFKHPLISKTTCLRLAWANSILNSTSSISFTFKNTFIRFKANKTLNKETCIIPTVFTANSLIAIKLINKFSISYSKNFLISNRQGLAITNSLNPKPSINEITLKDI